MVDYLLYLDHAHPKKDLALLENKANQFLINVNLHTSNDGVLRLCADFSPWQPRVSDGIYKVLLSPVFPSRYLGLLPNGKGVQFKGDTNISIDLLIGDTQYHFSKEFSSNMYSPITGKPLEYKVVNMPK
jgi:hypothetical protein